MMSFVRGDSGDGCDGLGINRQMNLAPGATILGAAFLDLPPTFAGELDAGTVEQQTQRPSLTTSGNLDCQSGLSAAQGAEIGDRPFAPLCSVTSRQSYE